MHFTKLLAVAGIASVATAHPGPHHSPSKRELSRRHGLSARCSDHVGNYNAKRIKRNLHKRFPGSTSNTTYNIQTEGSYYNTIQNDTCVLTPEVTEGPYIWPQSQTLRQDMTEGQPGVPLWLDVGVLDMETCEPLEGVLVDFWHCNSTGSYSSFTGLSPNTPFAELLEQLNVTDMGTADLHTDDTTFLRGMWPTDKHGLMEMKTVFPGEFLFPSFSLFLSLSILGESSLLTISRILRRTLNPHPRPGPHRLDDPRKPHNGLRQHGQHWPDLLRRAIIPENHGS